MESHIHKVDKTVSVTGKHPVAYGTPWQNPTLAPRNWSKPLLGSVLAHGLMLGLVKMTLQQHQQALPPKPLQLEIHTNRGAEGDAKKTEQADTALNDTEASDTAAVTAQQARQAQAMAEQTPVLTARIIRALRQQQAHRKQQAALAKYAQQVTQLEARIAARQNQIAATPLPASTDPSASYVRRFREKVEIAGNQLYSQAMLNGGVSGEVKLQVTLDRMGRVRFIQLLRSSGYDVLDRAAILSVERGAPYGPFDTRMRHLDQVKIIRTWRFK